MARKPNPNAKPDAVDWSSIQLTPLDDEDVDLLQAWQNSPDVRDMSMGFRFPVQKESVRDWLKAQREKTVGSRVVLGIRQKLVLIGIVELNGIDPVQRKAMLGIYVGDPTKRGGGLGYAACALLIDFAFNGLNLRKIGLEVLSVNAGAISLYEKLGFQREGVKVEDYFLDGQYLNTCVYGLRRKTWTVTIPRSAQRLVHTV